MAKDGFKPDWIKGESFLDGLGILAGTDKSSLGWDYLRHYERELAQFRDQPINVIEIGVAGGKSLQMWRGFFSVATLVGVDINPACKAIRFPRTMVEIGSQSDPDFLASLAAKYPPTVVIDDGSHQADHIRFTFEHLFPHLAPGGVYVVEDLHFHFSADVAAKNAQMGVKPPQDLLAELSNKVLAERFSGRVAAAAPAAVIAEIDRVVYIPGAVLIWKKAEADLPARIDRWEALATESKQAWNWEALAKAVVLHDGPLERAERAARMAIALHKESADSHEVLARVLEKMGKYREAAEALQSAIALLRGNPGLKSALERRRDKALELAAD